MTVTSTSEAARDALPLVPTTPEKAAATFRCPIYRCTLSGAACSQRQALAKTTTSNDLKGSMRACEDCAAGLARARLLASDYVPDHREGRRPFVMPVAQDKQTHARPKHTPAPRPAPCKRCGAERTRLLRAPGHPLRPYCSACVRAGAGKLSRLDRAITVCPAAVVVAIDDSAAAAYALAEKLGAPVRPLKPKREALRSPARAERTTPAPDPRKPCAKCGQLHASRRPAKHPLRGYCYACVQSASRRMAHWVRRAATSSPAAVAVLVETGDRRAAVQRARQDGAEIIPRKGKCGGDRRSKAARAAKNKRQATGPAQSPTTPSPSGSADRPAQPAGLVTEGADATCPASAPSAAPPSFEPPAQADPAVSTPDGHVAGERVGNVAGGSAGGRVSHPAGEPGADEDQGGVSSLSRPSSSPELAAPAAESRCVQPAVPFADPQPTPAALQAPACERGHRGEHASSWAGGGSAKGPTPAGPGLHGVARAAVDRLLAGMRADLAQVIAERDSLRQQVSHLTAALALAHGVHHG